MASGGASGPFGSGPRPTGRVLRVGALAVQAEPSLAVVAVLVAVSFWLRFAAAFSQALAAALALAATGLFFASILAHELAHATEARHRGLPVAQIRLGLLGGATEIGGDFARARDELAVAVAGPWTSIALAWAFGLLAWGAGRAGLSAGSDLAGVLGWMNALLAAFNLLPAAPLDGGRVLDAVVWWATGSRAVANRVATAAGLVLGGLLIGLGGFVALALTGGVVQGLWLVFLGTFLFRSALAERRAFALARLLQGHRAGELAAARVQVAADVTVEAALAACEAGGEEEAALVVGPAGIGGPGAIVGVVTVQAMTRLARPERWFLRVDELMVPIGALAALDAGAPARDLLVAAGPDPVAITDHGEVVAVVTERQLAASLDRLLRAGAGAPELPAGRAPASPPPPPAPPSLPVRWRARVGRAGILAASVAVVAAGLASVPMPLFELAPGPALDVPSLLSIDAPTRPLAGRLLLTSVHLVEPSALGVLATLWQSDRELLWRSSVVPSGIDPEQYVAAEQQVFRDSVQLAAAVGLRAAGYRVRITGGGAIVRVVASGGAADGRLVPGDVVTAVDGQAVASAADLVGHLAGWPVGRAVLLEVRRGDRRVTVRVPWAGMDPLGRPALGIAVEDAAPLVALPFSVRVRRTDLGGPSAGLMTALSVYALVSGVDVTRGRVVAGTGTIDAEGAVGAVGGVAEKVQGAEQAGASVFLVPAADAAAARRAAGGGLRVVAVRSFTGALASLAAPAPAP